MQDYIEVKSNGKIIAKKGTNPRSPYTFSQISSNVRKITTEEIREYLANYQKRNNCSNVTVDNVRRNISSFFSWLEEEDWSWREFILTNLDEVGLRAAYGDD